MLDRVSLFSSKRDFFFAFFLLLSISVYSILIEYNNYKNLTHFDSNLVTATLLKQYEKTKITKKGKVKTYKVLKLKSDNGFQFYSTCKTDTDLKIGQTLSLEIWAGKINFYEYMTSFYAYSRILEIKSASSAKVKLNTFIEQQHKDKEIASIYQALFTAKSLEKQIQTQFSTLGISHLIAISGFHLGVLVALLFVLLKYPYKFFQNRYFPYRSYKRDSFFIIAFILLFYLLFLDSPASLLRAFAMLLVGSVLHDRGIKIISMQTLSISLLLLLALFPRLLFSLGFYLSIVGVYYIFLFLIYYKSLHKIWQFILLPIWVYLLMLPYSLALFSNFSIYHPLSILWSVLFTLFYPLSIFLHIIEQGDFFDSFLHYLLTLDTGSREVHLSLIGLSAYIALSLGAAYKKNILYLLLLVACSILIYSIYHIAQF